MRVLQLIGDTDTIAEHRGAIELHRGLSAVGVEVRTLALAPGSTGGLEELVPAIAHARTSLAARTAVTQERRWADVVVLHGSRVLGPATLRRRREQPPTVIAASTHIAGGVAAGRGRPGGEPAGAEAAAGDGVRGPLARGADALRRRVVTAASVLVVDAPDRVAGTARVWNRSAEEVLVAADPAEWAEVLSGVVPGGGRER